MNTTVLITEGSATVGANSPVAQGAFSVKVNPNPIVDSITWTLETAQTLENLSFSLVDMQGKVLRRQDGNQVQSGKNQYVWRVTDLPTGLYLLKVTSPQWGESSIFLSKVH